jgi:dTMP kinase
MQGKLIAIEGSDASGKATQSKLLVKRLKKEGFKAELVSFPRYNTLFGGLVRSYLQGNFGRASSLSPEFSALLFALDRYAAIPSIEKKLSRGKVVVCDRFTASNIAHQAAKLSGKKQGRFIEWLGVVEGRLPSPSLTIYLDVPVLVSQGLMGKEKRKRDQHERNIPYLERVRRVFLLLARQKNWVKISCVEGKMLLSVEKVHDRVWRAVQKYL